MAAAALDARLTVADTSALLAFADRRDQHHRSAAVLITTSDQMIIPAGIMGELSFMIESRLGGDALDAILSDVERGVFMLDCGDQDIPRIRTLIRRYADLPLGYADASVIACAERTGGLVLTFDHHFAVVAREGTITVIPSP